MPKKVSRRDFVRDATLSSVAAVGLTGHPSSAAETPPTNEGALPPIGPQLDSLPVGKIGKLEFSRLMLGGNLIGGYAHARDLRYVSYLMKRYNTEEKILETLALADQCGINVINTPVWDKNVFLERHWKRGGKMKWIAQAKVGMNYDLSCFRMAIDQGASGVHMQGHEAERMLDQDRIDVIAKSLEIVKQAGIPAGVAAHSLKVIQACEKARLGADFYVKTLHTHAYPTAPIKEDRGLEFGRFDNSWCRNAEEVIEFMETVKVPWIAFKVMAAGAIPPQPAFKYAFNGGADFILAGMFDWQVQEDVQLAKAAISGVERIRPWRA